MSELSAKEKLNEKQLIIEPGLKEALEPRSMPSGC